jgi:hypothetical protein
MVNEIRIYFEGDNALKPGFRKFLGKIDAEAKSRRCSVKLIDANGTPVQDYRDGIKANPNAWNFLLLDSEDAITEPLPALCAKKGLGGLSASVFWMVHMMESWFLADPELLRRYYGEGFRTNPLAGNPNVEQIPKADVYSKLNAATAGTKKGEYHKTAHAPHLLEGLDPERVKAAAPNCKRMLDVLLKKLEDR